MDIASDSIALDFVEICVDEDLKELVVDKWKLSENLLVPLINAGVKLQHFKMLRNEDLQDIFKHNIGYRCEFRECLEIWKVENSMAKKPNEKAIVEETHEYRAPIKIILNETAKGRKINSFYQDNHKLDDLHKKKLIECIVEYFSKDHRTLSTESVNFYADQIVIEYPTEQKEFYYIPPNGKKNASGKLYDKAHNSARKLRHEGCLESKNINTPKLTNQVVNDEESIEAADHILWLQNNCEPWAKVIELWSKTFAVRRGRITNKNTEINDIISQWPLLKNSDGHVLIESDFTVLYPNSVLTIFKKWTDVAVGIDKQKSCVRDKDFLHRFSGPFSNEDSKVYAELMTLHHLLQPRKIGTSKKINWKPSVQDSIESMVSFASQISDIQLVLDEKKAHCLAYGLTLQPFIVVVGVDVNHIELFFVIIEDTKYKFATFLKALDIVFKTFQVLNLQYPKESELVYTFIQKYVYDIETQYDVMTPNLVNVLSKFADIPSHNNNL